MGPRSFDRGKEIDWAGKSLKWAEAIGQSLFYADALDKRPGIILLLKGEPSEQQNYTDCQRVCRQCGIILMTVDVR